MLKDEESCAEIKLEKKTSPNFDNNIYPKQIFEHIQSKFNNKSKIMNQSFNKSLVYNIKNYHTKPSENSFKTKKLSFKYKPNKNDRNLSLNQSMLNYSIIKCFKDYNEAPVIPNGIRMGSIIAESGMCDSFKNNQEFQIKENPKLNSQKMNKAGRHSKVDKQLNSIINSKCNENPKRRTLVSADLLEMKIEKQTRNRKSIYSPNSSIDAKYKTIKRDSFNGRNTCIGSNSRSLECDSLIIFTPI